MAYIGGLYTGIKYVGGLVNDDAEVAKLDEYLQSLVDANLESSVVSIFMMPAAFFTTDTAPVVKNVSMVRPTSLDGYTPKNKKLLTYPYSFMCVDTLTDSNNYRYEFSQDPDAIHFAMVCGMSPNPEIVTYPRGYNGTGGSTPGEATVNPTESVTLTGFPQCAFVIDSYREWLAQKSTGEMLGLLGSGIGTGVSIATGNIVGGTLGAIGMASQVNNMLMSATQGSKTRGVQGSSTDTAWRVKAVYFKQMSVTREYAEMIDDFFERYGYAVCKIRTPNRNARPHWTYIKTRDIDLSGSVPSDDLAKIASIYNKGITFWRNGAEVGNYNLDNSV